MNIASRIAAWAGAGQPIFDWITPILSATYPTMQIFFENEDDINYADIYATYGGI